MFAANSFDPRLLWDKKAELQPLPAKKPSHILPLIKDNNGQ
jgi:hypothetical protein